MKFEPRHGKPTFWFPTWSDTNQAVQQQKMTIGLKFRILKEESKKERKRDCTMCVAKTKAQISCA